MLKHDRVGSVGTGDANQQWRPESLAGGKPRLFDNYNNLSLRAVSSENGANIAQQTPSTTDTNQQWRLIENL